MKDFGKSLLLRLRRKGAKNNCKASSLINKMVKCLLIQNTILNEER